MKPNRSRVARALLPLAAAVGLLAATAALAASGPINLGKSTNDLPGPYFPIGGFRRIPVALTHNRKPLVLLMGTAVDYQTAVMRWPLVKALTQFGAFDGVKQARQACDYSHPATPIPQGHYGFPLREPCGPPTFDPLLAAYRSDYVAFQEFDLLDQEQRVRVNALPPSELRLYNMYARSHVSKHEAEDIAASVQGIPNSTSTKRLPLVLIGHYLQTVEQSLTPGDFDVAYVPGSVTKSDNPVGYLSFQEVQLGLQTGKIPSKMGNILYYGDGALIRDINIDANLFTALICRADGVRPRTVCDRPVIRTLRRRLR